MKKICRLVIIFFSKKAKKRMWRKRNSHNSTTANDVTSLDCVRVGIGTYGPLNVHGLSNQVNIGNYVSIAEDVMFLLSVEHALDQISTFPYRVFFDGQSYEASSKGDIIIDDDVWIGYRSTILSGVHIGQGAVVAAGSVVTKDVPPYAIVGGVPAKIIKYRFEENMIQKLIQLDFSKLDEKLVSEHINDLYMKLDDTVDLFWFPKKTIE